MRVNCYLFITFSADMKWTKHIHNITNSCKKVLGVIRRNFRSCSCDAKSKLYLSLVQPKLEYGSTAWHPITKQDTHLLDMIQRSAAQLCMNDYSRESSVTSMLKNLEWQSLDTRRAITQLVLMFKISHSLVDIVWQNHLTKPQRLLKNTHTLSYQRQSTRTRIYDLSFFPWTTKTWNSLPHNILDCCKLTTFKTELMKYFSNEPNTKFTTHAKPSHTNN